MSLDGNISGSVPSTNERLIMRHLDQFAEAAATDIDLDEENFDRLRDNDKALAERLVQQVVTDVRGFEAMQQKMSHMPEGDQQKILTALRTAAIEALHGLYEKREVDFKGIFSQQRNS